MDNRLFSPPAKHQPPLMVYGKINYDEGHALLEKELNRRLNFNKEFKESVWLIRESSVKGMLAVDYLKWNAALKKFDRNAFRLALVNKQVQGTSEVIWADAVTGEQLKQAYKTMFLALSSDNIADHQDIVKKLIIKLKYSNLFLENYLYPRLSIVEILYSPFSHCLMKDPVTIVCTLNQSQQLAHLEKIKEQYGNESPQYYFFTSLFNNPELNTVDRSELAALGFNLHDVSVPFKFISNRCVKDIIEVLSNKEFGVNRKIKQINELLCSPVSLDTIEYPCLIPSGHSYGEAEIVQIIKLQHKDPQTRENLTQADVTPNHILQRFMDSYKKYLNDKKNLEVNRPRLQ